MRAFLITALKGTMALVLDLYTSFVALGYAVGYLTDSVTEAGIHLSQSGQSATFLLMAAYFAIGAWAGGTPWQRVVGTRPIARKEPAAAP